MPDTCNGSVVDDFQFPISFSQVSPVVKSQASSTCVISRGQIKRHVKCWKCTSQRPMSAPSVKHIQYSSGVIYLAVHGTSPSYFHLTVRDNAARAAGHRGIGIVPINKTKILLSDWILVNRRLCAI